MNNLVAFHLVLSGHQAIVAFNNLFSSFGCLRAHMHAIILPCSADAGAEIVVFDFFWPDVSCLDDLLEHDVIVHCFGGDLRDFWVFKLDKRIALRVQCACGSGKAEACHGAKLGEVALELIFEKSMWQMLDVDNAALFLFGEIYLVDAFFGSFGSLTLSLALYLFLFELKFHEISLETCRNKIF